MADESSVPPAKTSIEYTENVFAPEVFASEATFITIGGGTIAVTFTSFRWDNGTKPPKQRKVVVGRLVLPIAGAQGLAVGLYDFLKKNNLDPVPVPSDPAKVQ